MADVSRPAAENPWRIATQPVDLTGLVRDHHAVVYRYAFRLCGLSADAEDLTQQTFLIAHQKLQQLRDVSAVRAWLLAVVRSCFLKSVRKPRPIPAADIGLLAEEAVSGEGLVKAIDREELVAALDELPEEFRLAVLMFYFEDLSYQQMAEQLEIPIGTVMSRLSRAKEHLRRRLAPADGSERAVKPPQRISPTTRKRKMSVPASHGS